MLTNHTTLYNPAEKAKHNLVDEFVVRVNTFDKIIKDIRGSNNKYPEQHYLIVGQRGSGKTTLLYRIKYEIEDDHELSKVLLPINLGEEQYSIGELDDLWESLSEILDDYFGFSKLSQKVRQLRDSVGKKPVDLFQSIANELTKRGQNVVLFIDNFGDLLTKFTDADVRRFREILMTSPCLRLIAGTPVTLESVFNYSEPFFEFFKIIELKGLTIDETKKLLIKLGEVNNTKELIQSIIIEKPERIEILRRLTGGVIRTMVLLFKIFIENKDGSSIRDLQLILDSVTPLYKHRMDDLPPQQQKIVDSVAKNWDGIGVRELTEMTRISSKIISSQLRQLEKNQVVEKIQTSSKNHYYQIKERFFNIWYLMRYGRKYDKKRVIWLVRFLETWCDKKELKDRIENHIVNIDSFVGYDKTVAIFWVDTYLACTVPSEVKEKLIKTTLEKFPGDFDTNDYNIDEEILEEAIELRNSHEYAKAIQKLKRIIPDTDNYKSLVSLFVEFQRFDLAIKVLEDAESNNYILAEDLCIMGSLLEENGEYSNSLHYFDKAIEGGYDKALLDKARILYDHLNEPKEAKSLINKYSKMHPEKLGASYHQMGHYYVSIGENSKAERYFRLAIEKGNDSAYFCLGAFYHFQKKDFELAVENYLIAVKQDGHAYRNLGVLYLKEKNDIKEATKYLERALSEGDIVANHVLGDIYYDQKKYKKARKYYETLLAIKEDHPLNHRMAHLHMKLESSNETVEEYFKKAIEIDGDYHAAACLAKFFMDRNLKYKTADAILYIEKAKEKIGDELSLIIQATKIYLWAEEYKKAIDSLTYVIGESEQIETKIEEVVELLLDFIAANQTYSIKKLFESEELKLRDLVKPVYYALMKLMKDEFPNEYLKMGPELEETVAELMLVIDEKKQKGENSVSTTVSNGHS